MILDGEIAPVDYAIFADTGDEPKDVYAHLQYLQSLGGPEIIICRASERSLGDDIIEGVNSTGQKFVTIPAFTSDPEGRSKGMGRRQCTAEYKIKPIERKIRELANLKKGQKKPKDLMIVQIFGLSFDEPRRVDRVKTRFYGREGWARAVEVDEGLRNENKRRESDLGGQYLHRSCQPLSLIQLEVKSESSQKMLPFTQMDCEGMCGN
jgi:hypothetical protein